MDWKSPMTIDLEKVYTPRLNKLFCKKYIHWKHVENIYSRKQMKKMWYKIRNFKKKSSVVKLFKDREKDEFEK